MAPLALSSVASVSPPFSTPHFSWADARFPGNCRKWHFQNEDFVNHPIDRSQQPYIDITTQMMMMMMMMTSQRWGGQLPRPAVVCPTLGSGKRPTANNRSQPLHRQKNLVNTLSQIYLWPFNASYSSHK